MTGLNIDKAVKDALTRQAAEDAQRVSFGVSGNSEQAEARVGVTKGSWNLAAIYRRVFRTKHSEGAIEVTKEF